MTSKPDKAMERLEEKWHKEYIKMGEVVKRIEREEAEERAGTRPRIPLAPDEKIVYHLENGKKIAVTVEKIGNFGKKKKSRRK